MHTGSHKSFNRIRGAAILLAALLLICGIVFADLILSPPFSIKDADGADIAGKTLTVWAGQKITLSAPDTGNPGVWELSGGPKDLENSGAIAGWSAGKATELSSQMKSKTTITFYPVAAAQNLTAKYTVSSANSENHSSTVSFIVQKPTYTFTAILDRVRAYKDSGAFCLGLGEAAETENDMGIWFRGSFFSRNTIGDFKSVQLIRQFNAKNSYGPAEPHLNKDDPPELDTQYPYDAWTDTPEVLWDYAFPSSFDFDASMYLLWTAPVKDSIPVPLARIDWGFNAKIGADWSNPTGGFYAKPADYNVDSLPVWTKVFKP
jgi:hypothetical protein